MGTGGDNTASRSTISTASAASGGDTMHTKWKSRTITKRRHRRVLRGRTVMAIQRKGTPHWSVHPGEVLREEFLRPLNMSAYELAKRLHVPAPRVNDILLER